MRPDKPLTAFCRRSPPGRWEPCRCTASWNDPTPGGSGRGEDTTNESVLNGPSAHQKGKVRDCSSPSCSSWRIDGRLEGKTRVQKRRRRWEDLAEAADFTPMWREAVMTSSMKTRLGRLRELTESSRGTRFLSRRQPIWPRGDLGRSCGLIRGSCGATTCQRRSASSPNSG